MSKSILTPVCWISPENLNLVSRGCRLGHASISPLMDDEENLTSPLYNSRDVLAQAHLLKKIKEEADRILLQHTDAEGLQGLKKLIAKIK